MRSTRAAWLLLALGVAACASPPKASPAEPAAVAGEFELGFEISPPLSREDGRQIAAKIRPMILTSERILWIVALTGRPAALPRAPAPKRQYRLPDEKSLNTSGECLDELEQGSLDRWSNRHGMLRRRARV